jgi:glucuronosyltransferase
MEAVQHGVPILGIPLYGTNFQNLMKVQNKGLGQILDKNDITETALFSSIRNILENPKFERTAQEVLLFI